MSVWPTTDISTKEAINNILLDTNESCDGCTTAAQFEEQWSASSDNAWPALFTVQYKHPTHGWVPAYVTYNGGEISYYQVNGTTNPALTIRQRLLNVLELESADELSYGVNWRISAPNYNMVWIYASQYDSSLEGVARWAGGDTEYFRMNFTADCAFSYAGTDDGKNYVRYASLADALAGAESTVIVNADTEVETLNVPAGKTLIEKNGAITVTDVADSSILGTYIKQDEKSYHIVKVASEIANGSIDLTTGFTEVGSDVVVTATPNAGYVIDSVSYTMAGEEEPVAVADGTFEMPAGDVAVSATFSDPITVANGTYYAETGVTLSYADLGVITDLADEQIGHNEVAGITFNGDKTVTISSGTGGTIAWTFDGVNQGTSTIVAYSVSAPTSYGVQKGYSVPANQTIIGDVTVSVEDTTVAVIENGQVKGLKSGTTNVLFKNALGETFKTVPVTVFDLTSTIAPVQAVGTIQEFTITPEAGYTVEAALALNIADNTAMTLTAVEGKANTYTLTANKLPVSEEGDVYPVIDIEVVLSKDGAEYTGTVSTTFFALATDDKASEEVDDETTEGGNEAILEGELDNVIADIVDNYGTLEDGDELTVELEDGSKIVYEVKNAAAIRAALENGGTVTLQLTAPQDVANSDEEEIALVAALVPEGAQFVGHYDIQVVIKADDTVAGNVTELSQGVEIVLDVSDLTTVAAGYKRTFYVVRYHNGAAEKLAVTYDPETKTIRFVSDKFSTFTVVFEDEEIPATPDTGAFTTEAGSASTVGAVVAATVVALLAMAGVAVKLNKR